MPFTRRQYDDILALVKSGQIDRAKHELRGIDDENAQKMLAALLRKHPDNPLPTSRRPATSSSAPSSPPSPDRPEKAKRHPSVSPLAAYSTLIAVGLGLALIAVVWLMIQAKQPPAVSPQAAVPLVYPTTDYAVAVPGTATIDTLENACQMLFTDLRSQIDSAAYTLGCQRETARLIAKSPAGADFCVENYKTTLTAFVDCLKRRELVFSSAYVLKPPVLAVAPAVAATSVLSIDTYPDNCTEAKAMGLDEYEAGSYSHLDRDNDGVACYGD